MDAEVNSRSLKPSQVIDRTEVLLSRRFPNRVVKTHPFRVPAFSRSAAGSDRGESWGHLTFDKVIFANPKPLGKRASFAIAVGREKGRRDPLGVIAMDYDRNLGVPYIPQMSGVWVIVVPERAAKRVINFYSEHVRGQELPKDRTVSKAGCNLLRALEGMIEDDIGHYSNIRLIGFDEYVKNDRNEGLFKFRHGRMLNGFKQDLDPYFDPLRSCWAHTSSWSYNEGLGVANELADRLLVVGSGDFTSELVQQARESFDLGKFKKSLSRLKKDS